MSWLTRFGATSRPAAAPAAPRLRLIGFPYAGGSAAMYARWHLALPADIEMHAVELPGHGSRLREPFAAGLPAMAEAVASAVVALASDGDRPFAFFGHSMGSALAFATARALRRRGAPLPAHLLVSARRPPDQPRRGPAIGDLPEAQFIAVLRGYNGLGPEVLDEPELLALFLPIIRADFRALEADVAADEPPLACPITAFAGSRDPQATADDLSAWRAHTSAAFALEAVDGDHFFVNSRRDHVVARVAAALASVR